MPVLMQQLESELGIKPNKIAHFGANSGQEVGVYSSAGIEGFHVEAIPSVFRTLKNVCEKFDNQTAIEACLDAEPGLDSEFKITSNGGQSSSLLDLGRHAASYPRVVVTKTIKLKTRTVDELVADRLLPSDIDFAVLDLQGAEDRVLQGADQFLRSQALWGLWVEVAVEPLYDGGADFLDLCNRLKPYGFYLKGVHFNERGWSDAMFCKRWWLRSTGETTPLAKHLATKKTWTSSPNDTSVEGVAKSKGLIVVRENMLSTKKVISAKISQIRKLKSRNKKLRKSLQKIRSSYSWRLTKPLREIRKKLMKK